jgi:hypothetical protein
MTSIQDIANATYRIGQSSQEAQQRTTRCAASLSTHSSQLSAVVRGSRSGEDAVRQVNEAQRAVSECAIRLATLQRTVDKFIQDLTK